MYIARDSDGTLTAFAREPQRTCFNDDSKEGWWYSDYDEGIQLDKEEDCYPSLTWEDDPIKVVPVSVEDLMKFHVILADYTRIKEED